MNEIPEKIAELSIKQFNALPKSGKPKENEWTILSCIVKEQNSLFEVVSLGTGSKCIGKSKMCPNGTILNDSHAEVMCRRAFLRYLYGQLTEDSLIFDVREKKIKFLLKPNIQFHFFTTHVPCGDAAIFPKKQNLQNEDFGHIIQADQHFEDVPTKKRKIDDIFRTGAKCVKEEIRQDLKGMGSDYHVLSVVRTKPGRGDPTASVSCSDKLAKWCHLGLQGALLMRFLEEPIYIRSFIILKETPFCEEALDRALFKRLEPVELTNPFSRSRLNVYTVDLEFMFKKKDGRLPCSTSIAWFQSDNNNTLEVAVNGRKQGITKKHHSTEKGRLKICKLELFKVFVLKLQEFNVTLDVDSKKVTYEEAKNLNKVYQENWQILQKKFGVWTSKDPGLLQFNSVFNNQEGKDQ